MTNPAKKGIYTIINQHLLPAFARLVNYRVNVFFYENKNEQLHKFWCINSAINNTKIEIGRALVRTTKILTKNKKDYRVMNSFEEKNT